MSHANCAIVCGACGTRLEGWNYDGAIWLYREHIELIHPEIVKKDAEHTELNPLGDYQHKHDPWRNDKALDDTGNGTKVTNERKASQQASAGPGRKTWQISIAIMDDDHYSETKEIEKLLWLTKSQAQAVATAVKALMDLIQDNHSKYTEDTTLLMHLRDVIGNARKAVQEDIIHE